MHNRRFLFKDDTDGNKSANHCTNQKSNSEWNRLNIRDTFTQNSLVYRF